MRKILAMVGSGVLALGLVAGCATEKRTVRTETETYVPQQPRVIEEEHTTIQRNPDFGDEETTIRRHRSTESVDTEE